MRAGGSRIGPRLAKEDEPRRRHVVGTGVVPHRPTLAPGGATDAAQPASDGRIWVERYYWDIRGLKTYYYVSLPPPAPDGDDAVRRIPVGQLLEPPSGAGRVVRRPEQFLSSNPQRANGGAVFGRPLPAFEEVRLLAHHRFSHRELLELPLPTPSSARRRSRVPSLRTHRRRGED